MSHLYDEYLQDHISGVRNAYLWMIDHNIMPADSGLIIEDINDHDKSKRTKEEYEAYDNYFYGNKSFKVVKLFNYAWLLHIHRNPHHWQYWVLQHDAEPEEVLEMPEKYVYEMICDWWSFSWKSGNLNDIFDWYEKHKDMKLHEKTRKLVEDILSKMKTELEKENYLEHHGIKGQEWGVKNGPPYPIHGMKSVSELSDHMSNFKYKEYDKLMSPNDVEKSKQGSCHDQVMYEFQQLRRLGKDPKGLFVMEYSKENKGGMTHSLVHYKEGDKEIWFDNAWKERAGAREYGSLNDIVKSIESAHRSGEFGDKSNFQNLIFGTFMDSDHSIGEDLQEFVDICLRNELEKEKEQ